MKHSLLCLVLLGLLPVGIVHAEDVVLRGGTHLGGIVLERAEERVQLLLPGGDVLDLATADIARIEATAEAPTTGRHLRYREPDATHGGGLDIALTHYVHPDGGPRVDLIGAVHIADPAFYREVQRVLERAGVVLYEGVKQRDQTAAEFERKSDDPSPVRDLQQRLAAWFGLVFQLDAIAYARPHFVHADLTAEEFLGTSPEEGTGSAGQGESGADLLGSAATIANVAKLIGPFLDLLMGKGEAGGPLRRTLKKQFARALGTVDLEQAMGRLAPGTADLLLTKRNAVVIKRLQEQRAKVKGPIAILYGAGHLAGLERALVEDLGYRRAGARWIRAWDVTR